VPFRRQDKETAGPRSGRGHLRGAALNHQGAIALLHWFRRLRIRWEIRDDIHHAFVTLGCAIICWRRLGQERLRSSDQK
jgi:hypothetical protein